jgi:hypothetical protein
MDDVHAVSNCINIASSRTFGSYSDGEITKHILAASTLRSLLYVVSRKYSELTSHSLPCTLLYNTLSSSHVTSCACNGVAP